MGRIGRVQERCRERVRHRVVDLLRRRELDDPGPLVSSLVACGGVQHAVHLRGTVLEVPAHDVDEELALEALGGRLPECVALHGAVGRVLATSFDGARLYAPTTHSLRVVADIGRRSGLGAAAVEAGTRAYWEVQRKAANAHLAARHAAWEQRVERSGPVGRRLRSLSIVRPQPLFGADDEWTDLVLRGNDLTVISLLADEELWAAVLHRAGILARGAHRRKVRSTRSTRGWLRQPR